LITSTIGGEKVAGSDQPEVMMNPGAMDYQGILIRLVSLVIDSVILGIITLALVIVTGIHFVSSVSSPATPWTFNILFFLIYIGYYTYLEGTRGQTIGKMVTKIKVVREDGGDIDISTAFIRNILRIVDGLFVYLVGAILIWRSSKKQRLGDMIAKTVVVKA
jgi:uncharacterized RDD family membrane protein YckC